MYDSLPPSVPARRPAALIAAAVAALVCLAVVGYAAVRVGREFTRPPTQAERDRAAAEEVAGRWQARPVGRIFPASLSYNLDVGGAETARRVGIGPDVRCGEAVDAALSRALAGCRALLRATYLDQPQGLAITVGVAAFPDDRSANAFAAKLPGGGRPAPGLRALPFAGSVTARFGDAARQHAAVRRRGPYVVIATIGYADGRPDAGQKEPEFFAAAPNLAEGVLNPLATPADPDCAAEGWSC